MSVPYYVRIFRQSSSPSERRLIYSRAPHPMRERIRNRFHLCVKCFDAPALEGILGGDVAFYWCISCYREWNRKERRKSRFVEATKRVRLHPHQRVCVDCKRLFESRLGNNLCIWCVEKIQEEIAQKALERKQNQVS